MNKKLENKVAVVTGGSAGIGVRRGRFGRCRSIMRAIILKQFGGYGTEGEAT
jgi:hypothetical protein